MTSDPDTHSESENNNNGSRNSGAWIIFFVLFLLAAGMLVYYQFYQGNGQWRFSLMHKSNDTSFLVQLKKQYPDTIHHTETVKKDSVIRSDSVHPVNVPGSHPVSDQKAADGLTLEPISVDKEPPTGTVYEVQIGTFENYDLKKYKAVFNNLHEEKDGKLTKLTLGRFQNEKQANTFKNDMIKLGVKKAWVVKKVNGKRID
jgi:hypothetical protein